MAINKTVNSSSKSHAAMKNCIEYVLKDQKTTDKLFDMTGPAPDEITSETVYKAFLDEKKLWDKDSGRMYAHNIISFHKDEQISPFQAFDFAKEFVDTWFKGFQTLISVHQDKEHVHIHMITNTVSYSDGKKLHTTRTDLQRMKDMTNQMCLERNLSVAEKGKHFSGIDFEPGTTTTWSKDKYHLFDSKKNASYIVDCLYAVMNSKQLSLCKEDFIDEMLKRGWKTTWIENRKNITFVNALGQKVRASNLSKTFSIDISKESLLNEFTERNASGYSTRGTRDIEGTITGIESCVADASTEIDKADKAAIRYRKHIKTEFEIKSAMYFAGIENRKSKEREREIDF